MPLIIKKIKQSKQDLAWNRQFFNVFNQKQEKVATFALVFWIQSNSVEIFELKVKTQFQKQQIGKQVIAYIKNIIKVKTLWVFANFKAIGFYQKQGFTFCYDNNKYQYLGNDQETILMSLSNKCLFIPHIITILKLLKVKPFIS